MMQPAVEIGHNKLAEKNIQFNIFLHVELCYNI